MDQAKLDAFIEWAPYVRVVEVNGSLAGLIIGLLEDAPYDSPNFGWFATRYDQFAYVDRVAIAEVNRGEGWGPALYRDFEAWAVGQGRRTLCAEVNTVPPNPRSLRFHDLFGFDLVDQFEPTGSPDYRVGMMVKTLR